MLVCKNAIATFWNVLWSKDKSKFVIVLYIIHAAPLHFTENKVHFSPFDPPAQSTIKFIAI